MDALSALVHRHAYVRPPWLEDVVAGRSVREHDLALTFGAAANELGRGIVRPTDDELRALRETGALWVVRTSIDEIARIALLRAAVRDAADPVKVAHDLYVGGDSRERAAVLRALPLLPDPTAFLALATEGCRTNVRSVFEAIAAENGYPARHFPDLAFHQMVLKAIFIGVPLARIDGLRTRMSDELRRMARDYASERTAAGRPVPADVQELLALSP